MPPKKKDSGASKKTQEKTKQKVIEDKTFGLKNKKGKKQQTFIKHVQHQVKQGGNPVVRKLAESEAAIKDKKKDEKKQALDELNMLFRPVQNAQKVAAGVDPKSVLCAFFKQGHCGKGDRCKFSHDLSVERKTMKRSVYFDGKEESSEDTMDSWDQDKLEEVINKKHGEADKKKPKTDIICKHFLEAIDKGLYGWFWSCPAGEKCFYKHALPPGFVLKKKEKQETGDTISIEELVEKERSELGSDLTPVTLETFLVWKKRKIQEKRSKLDVELTKKKEGFKTGKYMGRISGREMFLFKPEMAGEDDDEADDDPNLYQREEEDDDESGPVYEIDLEKLITSAQTTTTGSTHAANLTPRQRSAADPTKKKPGASSDVNGLAQACAAPETTPAASADSSVIVDGVPVEESLFMDDVDDLDLDEELHELNMNS